MAALTKNRNTIRLGANVSPFSFPVATGVKIYAGALVCLNASGYLTPGAVATTLRAAGRAQAYVDNTSGANGDKTAVVDSGIFLFGNSSAGDAIAQGDVGNDCYVVDDQTVAKTNGTSTRSKAGKIVKVDSAGVWVEVRFAF